MKIKTKFSNRYIYIDDKCKINKDHKCKTCGKGHGPFLSDMLDWDTLNFRVVCYSCRMKEYLKEQEINETIKRYSEIEQENQKEK